MVKTILLIGAAGGVGIATASALADRGHKLLATVLDDEQEAQLRKAIPGIASVDQVDLSNADQAKARLDALLTASDDPIDSVIYCAGIVQYGPVETSALADLRRVLEVNTVAAVASFQAAMPYLRKSRGRFVAVSSSTGIVSFPLYGFYSSSKHALEALADSMRMEARRWGVEVCLVQPGGIRTPMVSSILTTINAHIAALPDGVRALYADRYDMYRDMLVNSYEAYLQAEDVAASLIEAVEAATPPTRQLIGEDALAAVGMKRSLGDRELDAFFLGDAPASNAAAMGEA